LKCTNLQNICCVFIITILIIIVFQQEAQHKTSL